MRLLRRAALLSLLVAARALAQPAPPPAGGGDRGDAKQLMQTGVKLLEQKDYLGALTVFTDAYKRFASAKILLNIGTTLKLLDRKAEAANAYQRYLDSPDADAARRTEVNDVLADLDKWLGRVTVTLDPADAELEVDSDWLKGPRLLHVNPGLAVIHVRRDGYQPAERNVSLVGGQQVALTVTLLPVPKAIEKPIVITRDSHDDLHGAFDAAGPRSRIGAIAFAHVSVAPKVGSAWMIGATADVTEQLELDAGLLLGPGLVKSTTMYTVDPPKYGGYIGASFAFLPAPWRPRASVGMPIFASEGARFSVRGAGGVEYVASRHLSLIFELGLEHPLNPQSDIDPIALVPAIAATGRL
jgi:hypothetical protein